MSQQKLMGVRQPNLDAEQHSPEVQRLIQGAACALEVFDEDELEDYAAQQRRQQLKEPETTRVCGVSLPLNIHALLAKEAKARKIPIKQVALEHIKRSLGLL